MLKDENLNHVTTHRWPPVSYLQEMDEYRRKYKEEKKVEEGNSKEAEEGDLKEVEEGDLKELEEGDSKEKAKPKVLRKKIFSLRGLM